MANEFGKAVRMLRIENLNKLMELADHLNVTSAYVSAVECGRKAPSDKFVEGVITFFDTANETADRLRQLAARTKDEVRIDLKGASEASLDAATAFARNFPALDDRDMIEVTELLKILQQRKDGG